MELQIKKEYYLFSLLEGWLKMEVNFPNSSQEYLPTKKMFNKLVRDVSIVIIVIIIVMIAGFLFGRYYNS